MLEGRAGLRNRARCRNWRASHRLLEYPSETRRFQNEDQQSILRDAQGSEATWPMTKPSAFAERAAGPFPQALVHPHSCWKALPSEARRTKGRTLPLRQGQDRKRLVAGQNM